MLLRLPASSFLQNFANRIRGIPASPLKGDPVTLINVVVVGG
jgi:hypothetical protein